MSKEDVLHRLIDAVAGLRNVGAHEADALHDAVTPNYSAKPLSAEDEAQLAALQAKQASLAARQAELAAAAAPAPAPVAPAPVVEDEPEPAPAEPVADYSG